MPYNAKPSQHLVEVAGDKDAATAALLIATAEVDAHLRGGGYLVPIEHADEASTAQQNATAALLATWEESLALESVTHPARRGRGKTSQEETTVSVTRRSLRDLAAGRLALLLKVQASSLPSIARGIAPAPIDDSLWTALDAI